MGNFGPSGEPVVSDALSNTGTYLREDIAWQVALILVSFPLFMVVHALIQRELARRPELYYSAVRRWLTYIALVLTAIPILIDAAYTVQQLIVGQLTIHFFLDTLGLMVSAAASCILFADDRSPETGVVTVSRAITVAAILIVVAVVAAAFVTIGSQSTRVLRRWIANASRTLATWRRSCTKTTAPGPCPPRCRIPATIRSPANPTSTSA